jgi:Ca2+/Na+ antiporter
MIFEIFALLGAAGIAITIFAIIFALSDRPLKALITALIFAYMLFFMYLFILEKIAKRKEEKRAMDLQGEERLE